jgi:hypothetical protein
VGISGRREFVDPVAIFVYIFLGVAVAAFAAGLFRRRVWLVTVGTAVAAPACFLLDYLYWVAPGLAVLAVILANVLSAWALYRGRRLVAAILLVPFAAMVLATALTVPLMISAETTANASLGDLDGDGDLDVVLAKGFHSPLVNVVLLNDGKGHFEQHSLGDIADRSFSAPLGDLDGDGDLDIVIGNEDPDRKLIYFNDGKGHFTLVGSFGDPDWNSRIVNVSDLNGDGRPDVVVPVRDGRNKKGGVYICMNDGRGRFPSCRLLWPRSAIQIAVGDLTDDGAPDLVVPGDGGQSYAFINDGQGRFDQNHPFGPARVATRAVALGDLNGDGRLDIIMGNDAGGALAFFNRGAGVFSDGVPLGEKADDVFAVAVADLNGDGEADVVLGNGRMPCAILLNHGKGRAFTRVRTGDKQCRTLGLAVGDLTGDGFPEIVFARFGAPSMVWLNSLTTAVRPTESVNLPWHRLTSPDR